MELIGAEEYHREPSIEYVSERLLAGWELSSCKMTALLLECANDSTNPGARDVALITILNSDSLQAFEVGALDLSDYCKDNNRLRIQGKWNKQRLIYLIEGTINILRKLTKIVQVLM